MLGFPAMWFGLLHLTSTAGKDDSEEMAIIVAYESHRLFRIGAPVAALPTFLACLHEASQGGRHVQPPRCGSCGAGWEVPPLDDGEEATCASA